MNPTASPRPIRLLNAAVWTAAALALAGCEERVAGTSVGTGNPTEIQLGFKNRGGDAALTGRVKVYAATQIPVEGYRPAPLLEYEVNGKSAAALEAGDFAALPDSVWDKGSVETGVYAFNVVVSGDSEGSVLTGFRFDKSKNAFLLRPEDEDAVWSASHDGVALKDSLKALVDVRGTLDTNFISRYKEYHLFFYGTGFAAKVDKDAFVFHGIPDGKYNAYLISFPRKSDPISSADSTDIFSTTLPLSTENPNLSRGSLYERVRLPDSLVRP